MSWLQVVQIYARASVQGIVCIIHSRFCLFVCFFLWNDTLSITWGILQTGEWHWYRRLRLCPQVTTPFIRLWVLSARQVAENKTLTCFCNCGVRGIFLKCEIRLKMTYLHNKNLLKGLYGENIAVPFSVFFHLLHSFANKNWTLGCARLWGGCEQDPSGLWPHGASRHWGKMPTNSRCTLQNYLCDRLLNLLLLMVLDFQTEEQRCRRRDHQWQKPIHL